jgi:L-arabinose isomerase
MSTEFFYKDDLPEDLLIRAQIFKGENEEVQALIAVRENMSVVDFLTSASALAGELLEKVAEISGIPIENLLKEIKNAYYLAKEENNAGQTGE